MRTSERLSLFVGHIQDTNFNVDILRLPSIMALHCWQL